MGYERLHAIIVTGSYDDWAKRAHAKAIEIFNQPEGIHGVWDIVSPIMKSPVNTRSTFLVAPDGSKQGWSSSDVGDERRAAFVGWLEEQRYSDLSSPLAWVEVQYGDDRNETMVVNDSDMGMRGPCPLGCVHPVSHHGQDGCNRPCSCAWER